MNQVRCTRKNSAISFEIPKGTEDAKEYARKKLRELGHNPDGWVIKIQKL